MTPNDNLKSLSTFRASIRGAVRGLWSERVDQFDFIDAMYSAIRRGYEQAWRDGAKSCGIRPEERTPEEQTALEEMISFNQSFVARFADWVAANNQASGAKLENGFNRAELWINRYNEVVAKAQLMACQDKKLRWQWNPAIERHCQTCRKLNGRVHRASTWAKLDIHPRDTRPGKLECHGFKCGCSFVATEDRVTPGPIPKFLLGKEYSKEIAGRVYVQHLL